MKRTAGISRRGILQLGSAALCLTRAARGATLVRQPYLQNVQTDRASILWTTRQPGSCFAAVTAGDGTSHTVPADMQSFQPSETQLAAAYYQYRADFTGLRPGTEYSYAVSFNGESLAADAGRFHFRTAPRSPAAGTDPRASDRGLGEKFSFLVFGDSGAGSSQQQSVVQLMSAEPGISLAIHTGDLAYTDGTFEEFEDEYFGANAALMSRMPFFPTPGNHDYNTDSAAAYVAGIVTPECGVPQPDLGRYYSFDWGNAHFASVDSNLLSTSRAAAMLAWLDADLAATSLYWRIVYLHHTPYPTGYHLGDPACAAVQQLVNPIAESHGVQLMLAGHEHAYERTYPLAANEPVGLSCPSTLYVVTGGGGGNLESVGEIPQCALSVEAFNYLRVDVEGPSLTISAIGIDGSRIDRVTLGTSPRIAILSVLSKGDYTPRIAPGSLVAITGQNLAAASAAGAGDPLPAGLESVSVTAAGQPVSLLSVSPTLIEAQIPYRVSGPATLEVCAPAGSASAAISVSPAAPSLLKVVSQHGVFCGANPARPGDRLALYLTGLGGAAGDVGPGAAEPLASAAPVSPLEVWLGPIRLEPRFAGPVPGRAGVCRVDVALPANLPDAIYALRVVAGGISSRPANLDVVSHGPGYRNDRARAEVRS